MPIVNTLAFLFTVVGDWWVESKVISRGLFLPLPPSFGMSADGTETMVGMVLSLSGIALCVHSKNLS